MAELWTIPTQQVKHGTILLHFEIVAGVPCLFLRGRTNSISWEVVKLNTRIPPTPLKIFNPEDDSLESGQAPAVKSPLPWIGLLVVAGVALGVAIKFWV